MRETEQMNSRDGCKRQNEKRKDTGDDSTGKRGHKENKNGISHLGNGKSSGPQ